jgi:hypothetical protein
MPPSPILPARPPIICFIMPPLPLPPIIHHVGHLAVHLEKLVDLLDLGAGARRDALLAADALRISGLARSALVIEEMIAIWRLEDLSSRPAAAIWSFILPMPGIMPIMPPTCRPSSASGRAARRGRSGRTCPCASARRPSAAFSASMLAAAFSTSDDVAHAEDAAGDALGVEVFQRVDLFAGADQLDRLAGDGAHRKRSTAAAVAVDAGQHDAGDADALVERLARD